MCKMVLAVGTLLPLLCLVASSDAQQAAQYPDLVNAAVRAWGQPAFGKENWDYLMQYAGDSSEMTNMCGCAQAWGLFTDMHNKYPAHTPNPKLVNDFSDNVFKGGPSGGWEERVNSLFRNPYPIDGQNEDTAFSVLDGSASAPSVCTSLQYQGARLAHEMYFRFDKPGINGLRSTCNAPWPVYHSG